MIRLSCQEAITQQLSFELCLATSSPLILSFPMDFKAQKIYANIYEDVGLWRLNPWWIKAVTKICGGPDGRLYARNPIIAGISDPELPPQQRNIIWEAGQMH